MNRTDVKQVSAIHRLLTETLEGTTGKPGLASLQKCLMDKNTKALVFICNDLQSRTAKARLNAGSIFPAPEHTQEGRK